MNNGGRPLQGWSDNEVFTMQSKASSIQHVNNDQPLNITLTEHPPCWTFVISFAHIDETIQTFFDKWDWIGFDWVGISGWYEVWSTLRNYLITMYGLKT